MPSPYRILLVDDSRSDVLLLRKWFQKGSPDVELIAVDHGEQALTLLRRRGEHDGGSGGDRDAESALPSLILLDVHLPTITGFEVLERLRADDLLQAIPVLLLASTVHPDDERRSAELGAVGIRRKPGDFSEYQSLLTEIRAILAR